MPNKMAYFLSLKNIKITKASKKLAVFWLVFVFSFFYFQSVRPVSAQMAVTGGPLTTVEVSSMPQIKLSFWETLQVYIQKAGSIAFQRTLASALNTIAYDAANYIGSGGQGQKPLFVTKNLGDYLLQVGDEAAGTFIESFVNNLNEDTLNQDSTCQNKYDSDLKDCSSTCTDTDGSVESECYTNCKAIAARDTVACASKNANSNSTGKITPSFNVCSPSSLEAKIRIGLGLVDQTRPPAPNCTASKMIKSWGDDYKKMREDFKDPNYVNNFFSSFLNPRSNDIGIYVTAQSDLSTKANFKKEVTQSDFITNKGFLDVRDISGAISGVPGEAQREADAAAKARQDALGKTTGDILIDSANIFLNQLYISAFDNLLRNLTKKVGGGNNSSAITKPDNDPRAQYGESAVKEITSSLLQPKFGVRADYDILSALAICPDAKNPGPDNCVIDDKFMQAITEKKTVAEALKEGYLHGDWQLTTDNNPSAYSLRNISILRKYRILPIGWEVAVEKQYGPNNSSKKATLKDLVSCFDPIDRYADFSSDFNQQDQGWCQGLVDPNWVLKTPLNYCKKEGIGAQILNTSEMAGIKGVSGSADILSTLSITRDENYCADNQTCIKEKADGSCEVYGYCNEEKRTWNFGTDSCQPINNTCQSFTASSGQAVSYLENTLNYGNCNKDNSGCRQYSLTGAYATSTGTVSWNSGSSLYLNKNLSVCDNRNEGCTGLLRVKPTWGGNLIMDADFSNDQIGDSATGGLLNDWPVVNNATILDGAQEPGGTSGKVMKLATVLTSTGIRTSADYSLLPNNFQVIPGQAYTLSADVYLTTGTDITLAIGSPIEGFIKSTAVKNKWQHLSVTRLANTSYNEPMFSIIGSNSSTGVTFYIQNVKFEVSDWDTGFSPYGSSKIYEKLLPPYLEKACYVDATSASKNYNLRNDAPAACSNFARKCNQAEAGCELYTAVDNSFSVPAKVTSVDYCPQECLGYDVYISRASYFNSPRAENLIPDKTTTCSAVAAGCSEFTNLDELAQGGEQKEYYTRLKQCVKPNAASCASFYTWEGTGGGYQLKAYSLKKDSANQPAVTANDSTICNATIYNLPVSDPLFNPDCQQFYNAVGQVAYHLISRTITCSDNCHAYRMSEKNIDSTLTLASDCTGADKHWNANGTCNVCLNGGVWNTVYNACVYSAIPGEGQTCQSNENGCREYNGAQGSNVRLTSYYDFESGLNGWTSNCDDGINISTVANGNNGHSLQYNNNVSCGNVIGTEKAVSTSKLPLIKQILASEATAAQLKVGNLVSQNSAYSLKFLARATNNADLKIYFLNPTTGASSVFSAVRIRGGNDWGVYQANLINLDHEVGSPQAGIGEEILAITANGDFFLDDFVLTEITDRYYFIKDSSQVPDICYYDTFDNYQGTDYNLGCSQYTDRGALKHNLHQFSQLCENSAVGCEQMIDTKNYLPYGEAYWQDGLATSSCDVAAAGCLKVDSDSALYAVYDLNKQCSASSQGCSRLGEGQGGANLTSWSDVFKNNNPAQYNNILCGPANLGCEEWANANDGTFSYFKNPGTAACLYRVSSDPAISGKAWYKIPVKRCDLNGDNNIKDVTGFKEQSGVICNSDRNCANSRKCLVDNNDYPCSFSYYKTIGFGGAGNQIPTPDKEAGLCDASASGCTEYIDPVTQFASNLLVNSNFQLIDNIREGWGATSSGWNTVAATQQVIKLQPNKLYSLNTKPYGSSGSLNGTVTLEFLGLVRPLLSDNTFGTSTNSLALVDGAKQPLIFNSLHNNTALLSGGNDKKIIEVKELVVDYQLKSSIDKKSCSGLVNFDSGCILFNERNINGAAGLQSLNFNAVDSLNGYAPVLCSSNGLCTANQLLKVRPDRTCAKWLDCLTYTQDKTTKQRVCYGLGECDRLDDKGECANFVSAAANVLTFDPKYNKDASGYSLINQYDLSQMKEVGLNTEAHFDFEDNIPSLSCERNVGFPALNGQQCIFDSNIDRDSLIREPAKAPTDYPAHGKAYLKVPATYQISPLAKGDYISVEPNKEYYLNYLVNTKTSGLGAKVIVVDGNNPLPPFYSVSNNGWARIINKFTPISNQVNIYLTSDATNPKEAGFVYFDDVNIEPVLQIAPNNYVARECRLYPTSDSLTCLNTSSNTINDGLEGYCLQRDAFNPGGCLIWYPIDKIASAKSFGSTLGYKGKFPLNYCTQVNGNFDFVEKRKGYFLSYDHSSFSPNTTDWQQINSPFPNTEVSQVVSTSTAAAHPVNTLYPYNNSYFGVLQLPIIRYENIWNSTTTVLQFLEFSYPWMSSVGCFESKIGGCNGDPNYRTVVSHKHGSSCWGTCTDEHTNKWCVPTNLLMVTEKTTMTGSDYCSSVVSDNGWGKYDGFFRDNNLGVNEANNIENGAIRVYDYNDMPTTEEGLKLVADTNSDSVYRLTCDKFIQTVAGGGENKAWAARIDKSSSYPTTTPPFFSTALNLYGRNRDGAPFGAATWTDNYDLLNSNRIILRDRYSLKNSEDNFAGRPYGCSGSSCAEIGSCTGDSNLYCVYYSNQNTEDKKVFDINKLSCGGFGQCEPLNINVTPSYTQTLNNIFLKSYNAYKFVGGGYTSDAANNYINVINSSSPPQCNANVRPSSESLPGSFCAVYPKVIAGSLKLYYGDTKIIPPGNVPDVKGVYRLEFNTQVDAEQQPLKRILIDWGDGSNQIVTGQDQHPGSSNPHVFYHYYDRSQQHLSVKIYDNWDKYNNPPASN